MQNLSKHIRQNVMCVIKMMRSLQVRYRVKENCNSKIMFFLELKFDVFVRQRELARTEARATARATL